MFWNLICFFNIFYSVCNFGDFAISSRWDNEKVGTPANDDNNYDAGFNDGVVEFIYLPIPPRDSDPTPGLTGNKPPRPVGRGGGWVRQGYHHN